MGVLAQVPTLAKTFILRVKIKVEKREDIPGKH